MLRGRYPSLLTQAKNMPDENMGNKNAHASLTDDGHVRLLRYALSLTDGAPPSDTHPIASQAGANGYVLFQMPASLHYTAR